MASATPLGSHLFLFTPSHSLHPIITTSIIVALAVTILATGAELLHHRRIRHVARLAFGPTQRPSPLGSMAALHRVLLLTLLTWSLTILLLLPPKVFRSTMEEVEATDREHIILVLDVSPSMKLRDAGIDQGLSRTQRASSIIQSLLKRVSDERLHISIIATYNGAKPVVTESRDREVLLNVLDGLPMDQVFEAGKTRLFDGLVEAVKVAQPWPRDSATLILVSDGDTVPATGMPRLPPSIGGSVVIGVGDPVKGSFISGRHSRQDVAALRQIANRLGGEYHDGNVKHIPTDMLRRLGTLRMEQEGFQITLREYAILTAAISAFLLAIHPLLLHLFGSPWAPGPQISTNNSSAQES